MKLITCILTKANHNRGRAGAVGDGNTPSYKLKDEAQVEVPFRADD